MQGPKPIRGPSTVMQGGTIDIELGTGGTTVWVGPVGGGTGLVPHAVGPGGRASIPVPDVPAGTLLWVTTGLKGRHTQVILVEVISSQ